MQLAGNIHKIAFQVASSSIFFMYTDAFTKESFVDRLIPYLL